MKIHQKNKKIRHYFYFLDAVVDSKTQSSILALPRQPPLTYQLPNPPPLSTNSPTPPYLPTSPTPLPTCTYVPYPLPTYFPLPLPTPPPLPTHNNISPISHIPSFLLPQNTSTATLINAHLCALANMLLMMAMNCMMRSSRWRSSSPLKR